jgi:hypothetical protein
VNHHPHKAREAKSGFQIYYVKDVNSSTTMGIYEGQRPKLFSKKQKDLTVNGHHTSTRPPDILKADDQWGVDSKGRFWRESIWDCQQFIAVKEDKVIPFPVTLHFWYFGATEAEDETFRGIINTISINHAQQPR